MTAKTPDYVLQSIWNNARGIGNGPVVSRKEWQEYVTDLGGWFTYWGEMIDMRAVSIGGGMYRILGEKRFP